MSRGHGSAGSGAAADCANEFAEMATSVAAANAIAEMTLRRFIRCLPGMALPMQCDTDDRAAQIHVVELRARLELVIEVTPSGDDIAPAKRVAESGDGLPRQIRIAGAH